MAQENDVIAVLAKTVLKHNSSIQALGHILGDAIFAIVASLKPCSSAGCTEPATVVHCDHAMTLAFCDHHAAVAVVSSKNKKLDLDKQNSFANEDSWQDIQNAELIRRLMEYLEIAKEAESRKYVPLH